MERILEKETVSVEDYVRSSFEDIPIMVRIAKCESRFRQFTPEGGIFRGEQNNLDLGVMQINAKYHLEASRKLGYDIYTLEGNVGYARHLYEQEGTRPWNWSKSCWGT